MSGWNELAEGDVGGILLLLVENVSYEDQYNEGFVSFSPDVYVKDSSGITLSPLGSGTNYGQYASASGAYAQLPVGQKSRFAVLYDVSPAMDAVTVVAGDTAVDVSVVGVSHDVSSDGSKRHGLTFMTDGCVALRRMNSSGSNTGGWERSDLRAWLNGDFIGLLPDDLAAVLQPTQKLTNNVGKTTSTSSVTTTVDKVWAPSLVELVGADQVSGVDWPAEYADADQIFNREGSQYEYTVGSLASDPNDTLVMFWNGQPVSWWERSPHPGFDTYFKGVSTMGVPVEGEDPAQSLGVVACFCV